MFSIKGKTLDHLTGFSLALLTVLPVIRDTILPLPGIFTIVPVLLIYVGGLLKLFKEGTKIFKWEVVTYVFFVFLLFFYMLLTAFWNRYDVVITEDVRNILLTLVLVIGLALSFNKTALRYFFDWIIVFAIYTTIVYIYTYATLGNLRGYGVSQYLVRSMVIGMGAIVSISKLLFFPNIKRKKYGFLSLFLYIGLAIALGRAALLSSILIASVWLVVYYKNNWPKSYSLFEYFKNKSSLLSVLVFFGIVAFSVSQIEMTASKFIRLFSGREFSTGRVDLWINAVYGFFDAPLIGYGLSNSGVVSGLGYPHNLFLQVLVDGGVIALILLFLITVYPLLALYFNYRNGRLNTTLWIPLVSCYAYYIMNLSLASNFYEGRIMISLGFILVLLLNMTQTKENI